MEQQNIQNGQKQNVNLGFYRVVCEKHEYITVTKTITQSAGGVISEIEKSTWMQCKNCGKKIGNGQRF